MGDNATYCERGEFLSANYSIAIGIYIRLYYAVKVVARCVPRNRPRRRWMSASLRNRSGIIDWSWHSCRYRPCYQPTTLRVPAEPCCRHAGATGTGRRPACSVHLPQQASTAHVRIRCLAAFPPAAGSYSMRSPITGTVPFPVPRCRVGTACAPSPKPLQAGTACAPPPCRLVQRVPLPHARVYAWPSLLPAPLAPPPALLVQFAHPRTFLAPPLSFRPTALLCSCTPALLGAPPPAAHAPPAPLCCTFSYCLHPPALLLHPRSDYSTPPPVLLVHPRTACAHLHPQCLCTLLCLCPLVLLVHPRTACAHPPHSAPALFVHSRSDFAP